MTSDRRRKLVVKGRATLAWMAGLFVASQAAFGWWLYQHHPEMINPNYEFRFNRLQARRSEAPGAPLVIVVGSSRSANGFCPAALRTAAPGGLSPVVFNFATLGGGPVRELLTYRQMLARKIRPDWLLVEVWPAFWKERQGLFEEKGPVLQADQYLSDLPVLRRLYGAGWDCFTKVFGETLTPIIHYRADLIAQYVPFLAGRGAVGEIGWGRVRWGNLDDWGWLPIAWGRSPPPEFAQMLKDAQKVTLPYIDPLEFKPGTDWAMRQLLCECHRQGTKVALFFTPEHSALRSWYPQQSLDAILAYFQGLADEYGVPVVDAREWLADEAFVDFCHLLPEGAATFSARFGRDVLQPLLAGKPLDEHLLLGKKVSTPRYSGAETSPPEAAAP
jgi:hypothetical protein